MRPANKIKKKTFAQQNLFLTLSLTLALSLSPASQQNFFCGRLTARDVGPRASKPEIKVFSRGQNKNGKVKMKRWKQEKKNPNFRTFRLVFLDVEASAGEKRKVYDLRYHKCSLHNHLLRRLELWCAKRIKPVRCKWKRLSRGDLICQIFSWASL